MTNTDLRADRAVQDSLELVGVVREFGADLIGEFLQRRQRQELEAMVVALAAMVPDDRSVDELLAWIRPAPKQKRGPRVLKAHGTHAAFTRHRAAGEEPCAACWTGERLYNNDAKRRSRDRAAMEKNS